ncbi:proteinaceous RNase P 1, chloroplastic/mitochondrial-like isoform X1 [Olea europaea var. sylvestris]|uniref:ribonuclease P n=1 Tax=Olea europaea subsp. europaea TaxID=158383 RepID=A0A8S0SQR4_OLEEU|nr:proteinaceous RNase P 1, chloroplastic/mitochondrial-like isoform X1 [Olea europaea var. sylvestris]CAA2994736.1 aceous RNase P 1, chloroplastic mitochondrial [Olea europaea subsp. europaea]
MLFHVAYLCPKTSPLFPLFSKNSKSLFLCCKSFSYLHHYHYLVKNNAKSQHRRPLSITQMTTRLSTSASLLQNPTNSVPKKSKKKAQYEAPESVLRHKLDQCSKHGDFSEAIRLYNEARASNIQLNVHHYNVLLYLCSPNNDGSGQDVDNFVGLEKGFEIFKQMRLDKVIPNEATFTNASRLAAAKKDPEMAFELVKEMKNHGIIPKLRSYGPALFEFCEKAMADKAYEVDTHMVDNKVSAEEPELSALLRVSSGVKREEKVYEMIHRLRATVRQVSEETASIVEDWFRSDRAAEVGMENWNVEEVKEGIVKGGGGWHGQGWLGKGKWRVMRTQMYETGVCQLCREKLVCIDIDPMETQNFANSLAKLASEREAKAGFWQFQEWIRHHGPFDAVVDGANVGLINQHNFSFSQLKHVMYHLRKLSPSGKLPLVILHKGRVTGGPAQHPNNKKLLESWKKAGALYVTPPGSNDDWYWLYAAVSSKCLLVTNDEMRDHLFQLLGNSFFPRWKEKHQVRLTPSSDGLQFRMPPPYSIVIQESEQGSWHIPTVTGDDLETPRQWICATRIKDLKLN